MTKSAAHARGDELLARVLSDEGWGSGVGNELLRELASGYPVEKLSALLRSSDERVIEHGVWVASELGVGARAILGDLVPLYDNPNTRTRYYAVELALTAATDSDGAVIARAVERISDPEQPVRRIVFELLSRAESARLAASLPYVSDAATAALLEWLLEVESGSRDVDEIRSRLQYADERGRTFAAAAAARVYPRNPEYLSLATSLRDGDAPLFATHELRWLTERGEQMQRRQKRAERSEARERLEDQGP